jgi:hypothetical protein
MDTHLSVDKYSKEWCVIGENTDVTFDGAGRN